MVSTSAFEIVFAAVAETVDVPADAGEAPAAGAGDGGGAEAPFAEPADGGGAEEPAAAVTLAACLEPKWLIRYFRKRSFCPPAFALGLRPAPGFPPSIAWNSISTSSDLIAVFIAVYGFLIFGLVSTADTYFIRASHCQCSVASHAIASVLLFAHPSQQHAPSTVCAEVRV